MIFAEEFGPVSWSAIAGSVMTALVAAFVTIFNLRRAAKKEDKEDERKDQNDLMERYQAMFERQRKQCDDDKAELSERIDGLETRLATTEKLNGRLRNLYVQEIARRRFIESVLKQHKIDVEMWDGSTGDLPAIDTDSSTPPAPTPKPAGEKLP